ncbi:MAG TPA: hypothetical protein VJJ02_04460 [Candidatus Paceibacterota bacterium]
MVGRAADIKDLEKMLNDGEGDDALNARAIEIYERILDEGKRIKRSRGSFKNLEELRGEVEDFEQVINQIETRRHDHVLDRFKEYLRKQP